MHDNWYLYYLIYFIISIPNCGFIKYLYLLTRLLTIDTDFEFCYISEG